MSAPTSLGANPGYLKLELSVKGVRLDDGLRSLFDARQLGNELANSVELVLPENVCVSAPIADTSDPALSPAPPPFVLSESGDRFILQRNGSQVDVKLIPQPRFYAQTTSRGTPMWRIGTVYGSFIAINPAGACGYSLRGVPCRFCRSGTGVASDDRFPMSVQEVVEVVREAFAEGAVEFVYFNPAYVGSEDAGIALLAPYIRAIKKHFNTLIAVQTHPPKTDRWIDRTYAMGVDALSYSIEIHDAEMLARRCAGRVRYIGRERYYDALAHAASIFPSGTVWSDLILGLEPTASTLSGVDALVAIGVLPVLSMFRPNDANGLREQSVPALDALQPLFAHLFHAVRHAKINMGWVRDLSFAITPLEARFFVGDDARGMVAGHQFYRSRLGTFAARSLSRMRRRLRVRRVSDSFDASHL
jgi:hypothetical protein